jgi:hypothetical protein
MKFGGQGQKFILFSMIIKIVPTKMNKENYA